MCEVVADLTLEKRLLKKKHERGWGGRGMRYPASEKAETILAERQRIKKATIANRRLQHQLQPA